MILLALAATAAATQWTGPHTEQYGGPGYFCGGGYAIRLMKGDRALVLPQSASAGIQGVRLVLGGREIDLWSGVPRRTGDLVLRLGDTAVSQQSDGQSTSYSVTDRTDFALRLTSAEFRGFRRDQWFFTRANFSSTAENHVHCLAAVSY